jgi:hypothetical protein
MSDADTGRSIEFLKAELQGERARVAKLEAGPLGQSDRKVLAQTKINIAELTKALTALGVFDA